MRETSSDAEQPPWMLLVNPLIGAGGVLLEARLEGRGKPEADPAQGDSRTTTRSLAPRPKVSG